METIVIAEDHKLILEGYLMLINKIGDLEVVGSASDGEEAIELIEQHRPDYLILDLHMPKVNGLDVMKHINDCFLSTKVIIISMFGDSSIHRQVVRLGAKGYILKHSDSEEFLLAIDLVRNGKSYYSPAIFEEQSKVKIIPGSTPVVPMANLTSREKEILTLIAQGYTNKEIAEKLHVSHKTIDSHRTNLMKKIGVRNITGLVKYAMANGYDV
ncbi:response regulator containing a CheY-like receiver domain and an HTH DNA-binding domain [Owenweeksia hongkongensis DSM 17368]|uniref:Response regulator containing a CheY-like receiver domain and an HTH DNA-binding domain n=1 Tax=Owenweeksia hongkongensis (strain DSM 17368 / CIP 108786 / JCM 12287 / NRRL B-23963 / UST20020801) TaxID=926562 RepID=G8R6G2_OWEHD|nr:response regulator transcription factor [Owenweeksia hongkongensis]AEV34425.1 response regulator containing a CheY-like receiver domain and an HTH DNA-binding domain [Owenweeksia hongkongensis DSM 17368]